MKTIRDVRQEIGAMLERTRNRVRNAEEMAPREAAEMVRGIKVAIDDALGRVEAGLFDQAIEALREDLKDDLDG